MIRYRIRIVYDPPIIIETVGTFDDEEAARAWIVKNSDRLRYKNALFTIEAVGLA